ncbi:DUF2142 domain-containing protein [Microbacterium aurum]
MNHPGTRRRRLLLALTFPLLFFVALAAWAFSSPVAATPDEDFHLASTWCGLGERAGLCEDPQDGTTGRLVPAAIPPATCYAFHPDESAACWDPDQTGLTRVDRANADGLYPKVFYAVMSVFASPNVAASVMAMRLFNAAFAVGLLTVVFWALPRWMRPALFVSVAATSVPLGVFVLASINPSSWAILSSATVWITLYAATRTEGRRRLLLAGLAVLGGLIGAGARADSAVYAAFAVVLALVLGARFGRQHVVPLIAGAVIMVLSAAFYLSASQGGAVVSGLGGGSAGLSRDQIALNFLEVPSLWAGALGGWALGWIDTDLPATVRVLAIAVFAGALFVGLRRVSLRRGIAIGLAFAAIWLVPFLLLYQSRTVVGDLVQPRYILPLMVMLVGVASLRPDAALAWRGARLWLGGLALTIAYGVALHTNTQRYTTGVDQFSFDPGAGAEWWWSLAPSPLVTWIMGTIAFAGLFVSAHFLLPREQAEQDPSLPVRYEAAPEAEHA